MLSYHVDGPVLTLVGAPHSKVVDRHRMLETIRSDDRVPELALVLVDSRETEPELDDAALRSRVHDLVDRLGVKMGPACAVLVTGAHARWARTLNIAARERDLSLAVFVDEAAARDWLRNYTEWSPRS